MKTLKLSIILAVLALAAACGSPAKMGTGTTGAPLDPQGNWLFTFTGNGSTPDLGFAGQLYELHSPVVTSNEMPSAQLGFTCGGLTANGQASGTNTINLTVVAVDHTNPPTFSLTGTIATDQAHMSGTWTTADAGDNGCISDGSGSGSWSAQLIPNVTGTWTGSASGVTVSAVITENTDQTSATMGQLTGTLSVSGSPCVVSGTYSLGAYASDIHLGEMATVQVTDTNNTVLTGNFTVDPSTPTAASGNVVYTGGPCDGQSFAFALTRQ